MKKASRKKCTTKNTNQMHPPAVAKGEIVTKKRLAQMINKSYSQISRWEKDGMPSIRSGSGRAGNKINVAEAWDWNERRIRNQQTGGDPEAVTLDREKLRLITEQANEKALNNAQARGTLVATEHVHEFLMMAATQMVGVLKGIPGRIANEFGKIDSPAMCRQVVKSAIDRSCAGYSETLKEFAKSISSSDGHGGDI